MPKTQSAAFWEMIDGVLVVNLDSRPDRWAQVQALTSALIPPDKLQRMPATAGINLPGYGGRPWFRGRKRDKTWAGRAGCTLSHRAAIAHAKQQGWRTLLILEDDIELSPALPTVLAPLTQALTNQNWDVCYLGYTDPVAPYRTLAELAEGHTLCQVSGCSTTHAYLLQNTTFDWLLARLPQPEHIWAWISVHRAIDRWYYRNLARRFNVLAVSPAIVNQQGGFSDITQRPHEKVHTTQVPEGRSSPQAFVLWGMWRWLGFRLAEPRDWLRGKIKRTGGF